MRERQEAAIYANRGARFGSIKVVLSHSHAWQPIAKDRRLVYTNANTNTDQFKKITKE